MFGVAAAGVAMRTRSATSAPTFTVVMMMCLE
jgi:hypothetical protein